MPFILKINQVPQSCWVNSYGIGIGTTSPQYRLDVVGNGKFSNGLDVQGPISFTGGRLSQMGDLPNDNNAALVNTSTSGYGFYSQSGGSGKYAFHFLNQTGGTVLYGAGNECGNWDILS